MDSRDWCDLTLIWPLMVFSLCSSFIQQFISLLWAVCIKQIIISITSSKSHFNRIITHSINLFIYHALFLSYAFFFYHASLAHLDDACLTFIFCVSFLQNDLYLFISFSFCLHFLSDLLSALFVLCVLCALCVPCALCALCVLCATFSSILSRMDDFQFLILVQSVAPSGLTFRV